MAGIDVQVRIHKNDFVEVEEGSNIDQINCIMALHGVNTNNLEVIVIRPNAKGSYTKYIGKLNLLELKDGDLVVYMNSINDIIKEEVLTCKTKYFKEQKQKEQEERTRKTHKCCCKNSKTEEDAVNDMIDIIMKMINRTK